MLILKIAAGEGAINQDGIGDIHVAMLATNQYRVYVNEGTLPDGSDDACFDCVRDAITFAGKTAGQIVEKFVAETVDPIRGTLGACPKCGAVPGTCVHAGNSKSKKSRKGSK